MYKPDSPRSLHSDVCYPWTDGGHEMDRRLTGDTIMHAAATRLAVPTPEAFREIHARAKTRAALPVPNRSMSLVTLFDPSTICVREIESLDELSADRKGRLEPTVNYFARNPQFDHEERVWRVCCALQRVPLGIVGISSAALAAIPAEALYVMLMVHRRRPEKLWAKGLPPFGCRAVFTSFNDADDEWPPVEISTGSDATVTLIALEDELRRR